MVELIGKLCNGILFYFILNDFYKNRYKYIKTNMLKVILSLMMISILLYSGIKSIPFIEYTTKFIFFFLFGKLIKEEKNLINDFIFILMFLTFQLGLEFLVHLSINIIWDMWNNAFIMLDFMLVYCIQIYGYLKMKKVFFQYNNLEKAYVTRMAFIPIITGITFLFLIQASLFYVEASYQILCFVVTLSLMLCNILLLSNMNKELLEEEQRMELSLIKQKNDLELAHLDSLRIKYEENKKFMHDIKNHLQVLQGLSLTGKNGNQEYIDSITEKISKMELFVECSNKVMETLFNEKISIARDKNIDVTYSLTSLDDLNFINDYDVITIFANILDNAIEAAVQTENPKIIFQMQRHQDVMVITLKNTMINELSINESGDMLTTKCDKRSHGIGFKNVKSCLSNYNGNLNIKKDDTIFILNMIIPIVD